MLICVLMTATDVRCVLTDTRTATDVMCMLWTHTDVLCVLTDTHERPVCADRHTRTHTDVLCVLTDSHKQPRTSCVCWRTPMDVLCVLNRQPTWDKITQTVHGKGQHAESKDQRADMCTEGQPRTSCVC